MKILISMLVLIGSAAFAGQDIIILGSVDESLAKTIYDSLPGTAEKGMAGTLVKTNEKKQIICTEILGKELRGGKRLKSEGFSCNFQLVYNADSKEVTLGNP